MKTGDMDYYVQDLNGNTCLHMAAKSGLTRICWLLTRENNGDCAKLIGYQNKNNQTPFDLIRNEKGPQFKKIREWLDDNLDPGSVAVVDRWLEPWNEMARYAPSKVFVTFTVPDEPYETYRQLRWRDVTEEFIERHRLAERIGTDCGGLLRDPRAMIAMSNAAALVTEGLGANRVTG
jgi:hypothetical protein